MKKNILYTIDTCGPGGAETVFLELIRNIDKKKYNVYWKELNCIEIEADSEAEAIEEAQYQLSEGTAGETYVTSENMFIEKEVQE